MFKNIFFFSCYWPSSSGMRLVLLEVFQEEETKRQEEGREETGEEKE